MAFPFFIGVFSAGAMQMNSGSGRWQMGLGLSSTAMFFWGVLPIALKLAVQSLDVLTVIWLRFAIAFSLLLLYLSIRRQVPTFAQFGKNTLGLLAIAILGLALNYGLFMQGLAWTTASNAEVLIQLAPALFGLGGILLFGEHYTRRQWIGFGVLCLGLTLFFHDQIRALLTEIHRYFLGSLMIVLAAVVWVAYAFAQKYLLRQFASAQLMVLLYGGSLLVFTPFAAVSELRSLNLWEWGVLIFCGLNTLIAYGAFGEAMVHWEASRISAVVSVAPIVTLGCVQGFSALWPEWVTPEPLTLLGWAGAIAVVMGSWLIALGKPDLKRKDNEQKRYDLG
jgi:drug/metabolite transporter (DMT)-like permease